MHQQCLLNVYIDIMGHEAFQEDNLNKPFIIEGCVRCKEWLSLPLMLFWALHIEAVKETILQNFAVAAASGGPND